jgi:N-ethylmaleimide reductase
MSNDSLFSPLQLGALRLPNRIIMAPLTRMRAGANSVPTAMNAKYYAQRASAGLIISEGTAVSPDAHGYPSDPGIYTAEQIAGWRVVTDAVHARGGRIIMQIAHNGRNSHSSLRPDASVPVAPSAIPGNIPALTRDFQQVKAEIPRALEGAEIPVIVATFRQAALNAIEAGFDGVELQGANSHLIEQFLEDGTNLRTDNTVVRRRTECVSCWRLLRRSALRSARIGSGCVFRPLGSMVASTIAIPESSSRS